MPGVIQKQNGGRGGRIIEGLGRFELGFEQRISIETRARSCSKSTSRRKGCVGGFTDRFWQEPHYQMFVRSMDYKLDGQAAILVISPLISMIKDQISELKSLGYSAVAASDLSLREIRQCSFKVMFATAEKVKEKGLREILLDHNSPLHQKISAIVVDESHTVETWTGKR